MSISGIFFILVVVFLGLALFIGGIVLSSKITAYFTEKGKKTLGKIINWVFIIGLPIVVYLISMAVIFLVMK